MNTAHVYRTADGVFTGRSFTCTGTEKDARLLAAGNLGQGEACYIGDVRWRSQRVDLETGELVDYMPTPPDADHEWDEQVKEWRERPDVAEEAARQQRLQWAIEDAERGSARTLREALLELLPANSPSRKRLKQVDDAIAGIREQRQVRGNGA